MLDAYLQLIVFTHKGNWNIITLTSIFFAKYVMWQNEKETNTLIHQESYQLHSFVTVMFMVFTSAEQHLQSH